MAANKRKRPTANCLSIQSRRPTCSQPTWRWVGADVVASTVAGVLVEPTAADQAVATNQKQADATQVFASSAARAEVQEADAAAVVTTD